MDVPFKYRPDNDYCDLLLSLVFSVSGRLVDSLHDELEVPALIPGRESLLPCHHCADRLSSNADGA